MAKFKSYKHVFEIADRYAEGQTIGAAEAAVLNQQRAELISHRLRAHVFADKVEKGDSLTPELIAAAEAKLAELAESFSFGAGRASGTPRETLSPLEKLAREYAKIEVDAAVKKAGLTVGTKGKQESKKRDGTVVPAVAEQTGEKIYTWTKYQEKIAEVATNPAIVARAKKELAAREKPSDVEVNLAA